MENPIAGRKAILVFCPLDFGVYDTLLLQYMLRTSIYLPDALYERLRLASKQEKASVSVLVRDFVDQGLQEKEHTHLKKIYAGLDCLWGTGNPRVTDASTTIDETLYGERGSWRGNGE